MSISRLLSEFRPLFHLLEEPLMRSSALYARPQRMLLEEALRSPLGGLGGLAGRPAVDVMEEGDKYIVAADVPGVKKEDIEIRVGEDGRSLTIEGRIAQKNEEVVPEGAQERRRERKAKNLRGSVSSAFRGSSRGQYGFHGRLKGIVYVQGFKTGCCV